MARSSTRIVLSTEAARRAVPLELPGNRFFILAQPAGADVRIRIDERSGDELDMSEFGSFATDEPFEKLYITHDAVPGGELVLAVTTGIALTPGPIRSVAIGTVDQGTGGADEWEVADADARASLALLERNAFATGNPYAAVLTSTGAGSQVDGDVNAALGRNGRRGYVEADDANTGTVSVYLSAGAGFTAAAVAVLDAGDALLLDGFDVDTVRLVFEDAAPDAARVVSL